METNYIKNFGEIKNTFNNLLSESLVTKNDKNKKLFSSYLNEINKDEILKLQFLVYTNIENKIEENYNKAIQFVNENINLFSKYDKKDIYKANKKLTNILKDVNYESSNNPLYENIMNLIFSNRLSENAYFISEGINNVIDSTNNIVDYILNNKKEVINEGEVLPNSLLASVMVDKFNSKYASLNEEQKNILKIMIETDEDKKNESYRNMLDECINMIDSRFLTTDLEVKDKLLKVKHKILNSRDNINEDLLSKITFLYELKNTLTQE
jgi:hypothetical protein